MTMTAPQDYDIVLGNKEKLYLINMFLTIVINNGWKKHLDIQLPYDREQDNSPPDNCPPRTIAPLG